MKLRDMIVDKLSDAVAIGMQAKETIEEDREKRQEKRRQEEEQKRVEEERRKLEEAKKRKRTLKWAIPAACAFFVIMGAMAVFGEDDPLAQPQAQEPIKTEDVSSSSNQPVSTAPVDGNLKVTYIDVGQGDAIFIELPNEETMLIDAGNSSDGDAIVKYIQDEGFGKIDYLVATHPHSDHIGGMPQIVETLNIGSVYMPKVSHTTNVFSKLLDTVESKGLKIKTAKAGVNILDRGILQVDIVAPTSDSYSDLNNYSAVIKVVYGENSFLFMGDAEKQSEGQIVADINADVLKVGHHGSDYSTGLSFLNLVSPSFSIISVGEGNQYGHPNSDTINALLGVGSKVYRTDLDGTIVFVSDGTRIKVSKSPTTTTAVVVTPTQQEKPSTPQKPTPTQPSTSKVTVYITDTGAKYHSYGCQYLRSSCHEVTLAQAKENYLTPCSKCDPPQ